MKYVSIFAYLTVLNNYFQGMKAIDEAAGVDGNRRLVKMLHPMYRKL